MPRISQTWNRDVWCLMMFVFNVAPTGYHAKPLKCLQVGGCAIAPSIPVFLGWVCSSCQCSTYSRGVLVKVSATSATVSVKIRFERFETPQLAAIGPPMFSLNSTNSRNLVGFPSRPSWSQRSLGRFVFAPPPLHPPRYRWTWWETHWCTKQCQQSSFRNFN